MISPSYSEEIKVWIMAGEVSKNDIPAVEEIRAFKDRYPDASIDLCRDEEYSEKVLLANEEILNKIENFRESFKKDINTNPDGLTIDVKVKFIGWHNDPLEKIINDAQKEGIDVIQVGSTWIAFLAHNGFINSISDIVKPMEHEYINPVVQSGRFGNTKDYFAIPWSIDIRTWFYNKELLDRAGIDANKIKNLTSLKNACLKFKKKNSGTWFLGVPTSADDYSTLHIAMTWIWGWGGAIVNGDKSVGLMDDKVIAGMEEYVQLFLSGCAPLPGRDGKSLRLTDIETHFLLGEYAFISIGPWFVDILSKEQSKIFINYGSIPGRDGASPNVFTGGSYLALVNSKRSPLEEKASRALLRYLSVHASRSVGLPPQKAKLEQMLNSREYSKFPLILLRRESRLFPAIHEWGEIEDILLTHISNIFEIVGNNPSVTDTELNSIIRSEFGSAKLRIEKIVNTPGNSLLLWSLVILILLTFVFLIYKKHHKYYIGKEDLIRRFRRIKEVLHTTKVWEGRVDENNIIAVRDRLIEKINNVMEELAYFRNSKSQEIIEIIKFIGDKEILIKQYKNEIQNIDRDYKQYEESIIVYFENFMRPIINEMSNILETYCVKMNKFTEIIAELQKVFNFDYNIENKIGSLLIRPDDLRLCLENLLENAQKSTQHLTEPNIKLRVSSNGRFIIIAVEDNGGSFSEMDIKKLMRKGEGLKDICNIIEGWEGNLSIERHSDEDKKPPVTLKIKRL